MQELLSRATSIPRLLQRLDALQNNYITPEQTSLRELRRSFIGLALQNNYITPEHPSLGELRCSFMELYRSLEEWEALHGDGHMTHIFHPVDSTDPSSTNTLAHLVAQGDKCHLFHDISSANGLTHCWAFQIICLLQHHTLTEMMRHTGEDSPGLCGIIRWEATNTIALNILQSMDYLIQDRMHLYGQASIFFPLKVAHRVFKAQGEQGERQIRQCELVVERLVSKGLLMAATYLD